MIKHLLFDNDGTLVDSEIIAVRATLRLLAPYGFRMSESEYTQRFPGLLERDILDAIKAEYGITVNDDYFEELREAHQQGFDDELRPIPGMPEIFKQLKVPKSIVSNASVRHVEYCLERLGLMPFLDGQIFSAEQVGKPKP
ncbi:MAG: HAD hydrolase-like protein, partial [Saprospiraceae bacterium]